MVQNIPNNNVIQFPAPIRFGRDQADLRKAIDTASEKNGGDIFRKAPNADPPQTRIRKGLNKVLAGLGVSVVLGITVLGGLAGWKTGNSYLDARSEAGPVLVLKDDLQPSWDNLEGKAEAARETGGTNNPRLQGEFYRALNGFLVKWVQTMKEHPDGLNEELVLQLSRQSDFMPEKNAYPIAADFMTYMEEQLKAQGTTAENARDDQIERIDLQDFLSNTSALDHLSDSELEQLAEELIEKYKEHRAFIQPAYFTDIISGKLGSGIQGVTLEKFAHIESRDGAKELVTAVIQNSENFQDLTPQQRQALINRSNDMLNSIDFEGPSGMWGFGALLLLLAAAGGGVAAIAKLGKHIPGGFKGLGEVYNGLQNPTLVLNSADLSDPEAQRNMGILSNSINNYAEQIARLMRETYSSSPDAREILDGMYGGQAKLPDAATIVQQFIYKTKADILSKRSLSDKLKEEPVNELEFAQMVNQKLEEAFEMGDFVQLGLPKGMVKPKEKITITADMDPLEGIRAERGNIEIDLQEARKVLVNRIFGHAQATDALAQIATEQDKLLAKGEEIQSLPDGEEKTRRMAQLGTEIELQDRLETSAKEKKQNSERTLQLAQATIGEVIAKYQEYLHQLTEAIDGGIFARNVEDLNAVRQQAASTLEDPTLQDLIDKAELQKYIKQAEDADKAKEEESLQIRAKLAALREKSA